MDPPAPGPEPAPEPEPAWQRSWSVEEIRRSCQTWSLAADAGLLQFLQEFSQQTISRTHEIKKQVDGLIQETKATDCRLHNVFNDFLMLSNTQFIENRVYDEEVEEPVVKAEAEKAEQEKTREQKEVDLIPKVREAVNYGLQVLDSAFEQLDIKAGNSDSEEEDANERVELILEPKDLYIDRPLPYLIGSKLFMEQEDVGLGELSSEEGSVGSDRGSIVDSEEENEEEESEEDFANHSDNDQIQHTAQMSDEEEEEDGCDIFADSEKEEEDIEDIEENPRPKRPTSFADELAARIKVGATSQMEEEQRALSTEVKPQKTLKEKKERRTPSDEPSSLAAEEEDDLFTPPKLTDADFSPFGSGGGLFSGGKGLFDDEEEEEESDLFVEAPGSQEAGAAANEVSSSSKPGKKIPAGAVSVFLGDTDVLGAASAPAPKEPKQPTPGKRSYLPATGLFDEDEDDDFFAASCGKPKTDKIKSTANIFDEEEGDLFKEQAVSLPEATVNQTDENKARVEEKVILPSNKNLKLLPETKTQKGLFSDEEDTEDLFSSQNVSKSKDASLLPSKLATSVSLFDDEDEEDLFGATAAKKQASSLPTLSQEKAKLSEPPKKKAPALLFSSDEEDQWNGTDSQTNSASDDRSKGELRNSEPRRVQETVQKTSLFEEDDKDDLFAIAKDSQKKTQRASLLFEDDTDSGSSLFGSPPTSIPPATTKKETVPVGPPSLFSDEEEEVRLGEKPMDKKVESGKEVSEFGSTRVVEESEKEGPLTVSTQEAVTHSDLFSSSSQDKGTKSRTKTVLSLFDEEEDKTEDPCGIQSLKKEVGKSPAPAALPKSTGVFQDEELLFSHKPQKDNDPDVDLFSGARKTRLLEPSAGSLFGDDEDDDLFSSAKPQPVVSEKKRVVKKDHPVSSCKNQKHPESTQGIKEKRLWKPETAQDSPGPAPFKTKEPSPRIWKIQANLAINPAALLPAAAPQISGTHSVLPELASPSSEPGRIQSLETIATLTGSGEAGVSFDVPAQADTLHSANKSRVKLRGKRRPQTRAARRLAAQDSSEAEDASVPGGPKAQASDGAIPPAGYQPQPRAAGGEERSEEAVAAATLTWAGGLVPGKDRSPSGPSPGQPLGGDLFDSEDIFSKATEAQPAGRSKAKAKAAGSPGSLRGGSGEKSPVRPALAEAGSDDDLFRSAKPKPAQEARPFPLLDGEDALFPGQKGKRNKSKPSGQQAAVSKAPDIFEDDIFATEAIKPLQKTREKERTFEPNLFNDNIDIFADLTVKPKEKSKKKVEAKSIFDDDMDDIFSGTQAKTAKPKSRSSQAAPEPRSEQKVANIFDDPLNAFGGQ